MVPGRVGLKVRDIEDLLTLYGVADGRERAKVISLVRRHATSSRPSKT